MARYPKYAPDFRIRINDEEMPAGVRAAVTNVRYQDGHQAADRVEIGIANPNLRWLQRHIRGLGFRPFPDRRQDRPGARGRCRSGRHLRHR